MNSKLIIENKNLEHPPLTIKRGATSRSRLSMLTADSSPLKNYKQCVLQQCSSSYQELGENFRTRIKSMTLSRKKGLKRALSFTNKMSVHAIMPHIYEETNDNLCDNENEKAECLFCSLKFDSNIKLQVHLNTYIHEQAYDHEYINKNLKDIELTCRLCGGTILYYLLNTHKCLLEEYQRFLNKLEWINTVYSPLVCILCKSLKVFDSQAGLQIHLITAHGPNKHLYGCTVCGSKFKTTDKKVHEHHALDLHSSVLNFYHKIHDIEALEKKSKKDKEKEQFRYSCLFNSLHSTGNSKVVCSEVITDIFKLTIHTLCFHSYCIPKKFGRKNQEEDDRLLCHSCLKQVNNGEEFENHILGEHTSSVFLRKEFLTKRNMLSFLLPMDITCLVCLHVFPGVLELQIHILVNHSTRNNGYCGLCNYYLLSMYFPNKEEQEKENMLENYSLAWKRITYHESLHVKQFLEYIETKTFQKSLIKPPYLFQSLDEFLEFARSRYMESEDPLLTEEQIQYFMKLGEINYENQIIMELNNAY